MQKIKIILFRDGRPGHEKQSRGVLNALKRYVDTDISEVMVAPQPLHKKCWIYFNYFMPLWVKNNKFQDVDLIIGTGSSTHIPLLSCKKQTNGRAVICMKPSLLISRLFDLCFVPMHDRPRKVANVFETIGPPNMSEVSSSHDPKKGLILIGGENSATKKWDNDQLLSNIKALIQRAEIEKWTISTSPRTPDGVDSMLSEMVRDKKGISYFSYKETEPGWIDQQYSVNKTVWVTGDSMSMVYEALSAGCNVGILPVDWKNKKNKYKYSSDYLKSRKLIITFNQWGEGDLAAWEEKNLLAEADNCAREIVKRWWPEYLL